MLKGMITKSNAVTGIVTIERDDGLDDLTVRLDDLIRAGWQGKLTGQQVEFDILSQSPPSNSRIHLSIPLGHGIPPFDAGQVPLSPKGGGDGPDK